MGVQQEQIHKAYRDWQNSITVFNNADTNEDIDYAVFNMEAKKKQYLKLLHSLRRSEEIENEDIDFDESEK